MSLPIVTFRRCAGALALAALLALPASLLASPANDVCSGAVAVPGNGPFPYAAAVVDTTSATNDVGDPAFSCLTKFSSPPPAGAVSHSVWYTFTPSSTDNYQIDTLGTTPSFYDTILAIFTGSCGSLTPVSNACNDDAAGSLQSQVQVRLTAGTTYYILVSGLGSRDPMDNNHIIASAGGQLRLNVDHVAVNYPYSYVIPSVAHAQGVTLYVSDLNVTSADNADGTFTVQFLNHGNFGDASIPSPQPTSAPNTIAANGSVLFPDVLSALGVDTSSNPYGALLIRSTVKLLVGARTYTTAASGGTFGQYALGVDTSQGILANTESGRFIGLRENANARTNLAMFNLANARCNVQFELKGANGATVGSKQTLLLPPYTMAQVNGLRSLFGASTDVLNNSIVVTDLTPGCLVGGVAYVIDGNSTPGTNDPFAVPLQKQ